jgi:hypothetical protein
VKSTSPSPAGFLRDLSNLFLLGCLLVFALFLWLSYQMEEASSYLLPRALAVFGIVATMADLARAFFRPREGVDEGAHDTKGIPVLASTAFAAVYFFAIPWLGFVLATALAIVGFSFIMGFPRKTLVAILAVAVPVLLHLTFVELLKAPLPGGFGGALPF